MTRKTKVRLALVAGLVIIGCPCALLAFWAAASMGSDAGSPKLAEEWRTKLAPIDSPEAAARAGVWEVYRFPNGEWAVALSANSHGIWVRGGGTAVIKDSRGQTRAFFGHVCGCLPPCSECKSLDEFYTKFDNRQEHHFD